MHKWIQLAEKPLEHLDYTNLATQICKSNHSSPDFGQNQTKKIAENNQKIKRLDYYNLFTRVVDIFFLLMKVAFKLYSSKTGHHL